MPARIDATPIATIGQPAGATRYRPNALATANAAIIARFIAAALIRPAETARSGPMRSAPSAPFSASNTSFAKMVPLWIAIAPASAASAAPHAMPPHARATAVPTITGTIAAGSVRRRAAAIQTVVDAARSDMACTCGALDGGEELERGPTDILRAGMRDRCVDDGDSGSLQRLGDRRRDRCRRCGGQRARTECGSDGGGIDARRGGP